VCLKLKPAISLLVMMFVASIKDCFRSASHLGRDLDLFFRWRLGVLVGDICVVGHFSSVF